MLDRSLPPLRTRRQRRRVALLLTTAALLLAACGGDDGERNGEDAVAGDAAPHADGPADDVAAPPADAAADDTVAEDAAPDAAGPPTLAAGVAVRDITPTFERYTDENGNRRWDDGEPFEDDDGDGELDSLWVGGFTVRQPTDVHDPLTTRALALQIGDEAFVLAAIDALGVGLARLEDIKARVLAAADPSLGLTAERLVVASTHTHHAPDTIGIFGPGDTDPAWDPDYLELVVAQTTDAILAALAALEPAELVVAEAEAGEGYVRDLTPPEIVDPVVAILQVRAADGAVIATAVSIANHPETVWKENTQITADYPGVLRAALETTQGGTALYFSGALGLMQSPAEIGERGFDRAQRIGEAYAALVDEALAAAAPAPAEALRPRLAFDHVTTPLENIELYVGVSLGIVDGYSDYLYKTDSYPCQTLGCLDVPVAVLRLGDHVTLLALPGEFTPELIVGGITAPPDHTGPYPDAPPEPVVADHLATPHRFVIGLANAEVGYVYPKITHDAVRFFDQRNGPGANAASYLMGGLTRLLDEVNESSASDRY